MNKTSDNFTTPKQTKRLGLKCNSSVLKDSVEKPTTTTTTLVCKTKSAPKRQPQSDVRVNYRNSEPAFHTPGTPKTSSDQQRQAVSTNCRPFRLSLSKKVREKMTKKRLEFHLANEIEKDEEEESEINLEVGNKTGEVYIGQDNTKIISEVEFKENNDSRSEIPGNMTSDELKAQIEILRSDLIIRQEHAKKVSELQEAIDIWKQGFSSALSDLQGKIETRLDTETLLDQLKIPQEMIKYVND